MTTTTFVLNDRVLDNLGKVRKFAEDCHNWNAVCNQGKLQMTDFSHVLSSGDVQAAFSWAIVGDVLIRHLSVRSKKWQQDHSSYVDPTVAFTIAHFLGYTGSQISRTGMVVDPGKNWRVGSYPNDGSFVVQQEVQKVPLA